MFKGRGKEQNQTRRRKGKNEKKGRKSPGKLTAEWKMRKERGIEIIYSREYDERK